MSNTGAFKHGMKFLKAPDTDNQDNKRKKEQSCSLVHTTCKQRFISFFFEENIKTVFIDSNGPHKAVLVSCCDDFLAWFDWSFDPGETAFPNISFIAMSAPLDCITLC